MWMRRTRSMRGPFGNGIRHVKFEPGQLVLFPSWILHDVKPYEGEGERITVAFNCWFSLKDDGAAYPLATLSARRALADGAHLLAIVIHVLHLRCVAAPRVRHWMRRECCCRSPGTRLQNIEHAVLAKLHVVCARPHWRFAFERRGDLRLGDPAPPGAAAFAAGCLRDRWIQGQRLSGQAQSTRRPRPSWHTSLCPVTRSV